MNELWTMMKTDNTLNARQLTALKLLASGTPDHQVVERLEITRVTLYRWKQLPEFEEKLRTITNSGLEQVAKKMNALALTAAETLQYYMCDMSLPADTQIKLALGVLNAMPKVNGALEKSLQHRSADFDVKTRFKESGFTYDADGNTCQSNMEKLGKASSADMASDEVVVV